MNEFIGYYPLGTQGFILTHLAFDNRSGSSGLVQENLNGQKMVYSSDIKEVKKFALSNKMRVAGFLMDGSQYNIGSEKIIDKFFISPNIYHFYMNFDFKSTSPFVLIAYDDNSLFELRWNGSSHGLTNLNVSESYVWDSKTRSIKKVEVGRSAEFSTSYLIRQVNEMFPEEALAGKAGIATTIDISGSVAKMIYESTPGKIVEEVIF